MPSITDGHPSHYTALTRVVHGGLTVRTLGSRMIPGWIDEGRRTRGDGWTQAACCIALACRGSRPLPACRSPEHHPAARLVRWVISAACLSACTLFLIYCPWP